MLIIRPRPWTILFSDDTNIIDSSLQMSIWREEARSLNNDVKPTDRKTNYILWKNLGKKTWLTEKWVCLLWRLHRIQINQTWNRLTFALFLRLCKNCRIGIVYEIALQIGKIKKNIEYVQDKFTCTYVLLNIC